MRFTLSTISLLRLLPLLLPAFVSATSSSSSTPNQDRDPDPDTDLICHPNTPCYPHIFVPTTSFQVIHDDQEIPPGLHVRLNLSTGLREAKLIDPTEDTDDADKLAVVVSDSDPGVLIEIPEVPQPKTEESYAPPKHLPPGDGNAFYKALDTLRDTDLPLKEQLEALGTLEELAHERHWGAEFCTAANLTPLLSSISTHADPSYRAGAALLLGSALSNNPEALNLAISVSGSSIVTSLLSALESEADVAARKRVIYALAQVLKSPATRNIFLRDGKGVEVLRGVWADPSSSRDVRARVATLVEDSFLNEDMRGDGEGGEENLEVLKGFCGDFKSGLVQAGASGDVRVFSALVGLQAAVGCSQNKEFERWVGERRGVEGTVESLIEEGRELEAMVKLHWEMVGDAQLGDGELR